jgi:hypothetical protein
VASVTWLFTKLLKALPVIGAVLVVAAVGRSWHDGRMDQLSLALIGLGFVFFLAMMLKIDTAGVTYYANLSLTAGVTLGILACLYMLVDRHGGRLDLTSNGRQSLSPQTCKILHSLARPVHLRAYVVSNEPLRSYLGLFQAQSPFVTFDIRNPYQDVSLFDTPGEEIKDNDIVVTSGEGKAERRSPSIKFKGTGNPSVLENDIVNAILNVMRERPARVYFVTNHGEKTPQDVGGENAGARSFSKFAGVLTERGIQVRLFDLATDRMVPDDCDTLGIVGPTSDYSIAEVHAIETYLSRGGRLLAMLDPPLSEMARVPRVRGLLTHFGLDVSESIVLDQGSHSAEHNALVPLIRTEAYNPLHPITEPLQGVLGGLPMPLASPVSKTKDVPPDMDIRPLLSTSDQAWAIGLADYAEIVSSKKISVPSSAQWQKLMLAMAAAPKPGAAADTLPRIVAVGDSDFITDSQLGQAQATLAYRMVTWLTGQNDQIAIPPPALKSAPIVLDPRQWMLISIFSVVVAPFAVFFAGVAYTTIRRRRR